MSDKARVRPAPSRLAADIFASVSVGSRECSSHPSQNRMVKVTRGGGFRACKQPGKAALRSQGALSGRQPEWHAVRLPRVLAAGFHIWGQSASDWGNPPEPTYGDGSSPPSLSRTVCHAPVGSQQTESQRQNIKSLFKYPGVLCGKIRSVPTLYRNGQKSGLADHPPSRSSLH